MKCELCDKNERKYLVKTKNGIKEICNDCYIKLIRKDNLNLLADVLESRIIKGGDK